jgi:hypothetical protein
MLRKLALAAITLAMMTGVVEAGRRRSKPNLELGKVLDAFNLLPKP